MFPDEIKSRLYHDTSNTSLLDLLRADTPLFILLLCLSAMGLGILYSASGQDIGVILRQLARLGVAYAIMLMLAQVPVDKLRSWTPWLYSIGLLALLAVFFTGTIGKGAQRWLDLGFIRFQPSEMMKLMLPMMIAWYLANKPIPLKFTHTLLCAILIGMPMGFIIEQPDLGTALLVGSAGFFALFLAGIRWRILITAALGLGGLLPFIWSGLHGYQQQRVLTFLNPETDPLGAGYHTIQSKIAIGSGGVYGKGWFNGTQSHLDFLPERSTDFIFSVYGEEFGLFGAILLLTLYILIISRSLYIASKARDTFSRILAGSLSLTFTAYVGVNIGMVTGLLPVVGVPLPLISYGGTSMVTIMAGFGILMSIRADKRILTGA